MSKTAEPSEQSEHLQRFDKAIDDPAWGQPHREFESHPIRQPEHSGSGGGPHGGQTLETDREQTFKTQKRLTLFYS